MDASGLFVFVIVLSVGVFCNAMPQENLAADDQPSEIAPSNTDTSLTNLLEKCTTATGGSGVCVPHLHCSNIDQTQNAPNGYANTCEYKEVCCPAGSQTPEKDYYGDDASPPASL